MISRRKLIRSAVAAPAIIKLWPALIREAKAVCTPTGLVPAGTFTEPASLPLIPGPGGAGTTQLPNLFVLRNGTSVTTKVQWAQKRAEIRQMANFYGNLFTGGYMAPPSPVTVVGSPVDTTITTAGVGTMLQRAITATTGPSGQLNFVMNLYIPQNSGAGPFPVIMTGEKAWSPLIGNPSAGNVNGASPGQVTLNTLVNRGYILCEYDRDNFSWDSGDLANDDLIYTTNSAISSTNLYKLYPLDRNSGPVFTMPGVTAGINAPPSGLGALTGYDWGHIAAWVWGGLRCVDLLMSLSYVDKNKVGTTGISRGCCVGGLGTIDDRIAIGLPNQGLGLLGTRCQEAAGPNNWTANPQVEPNGRYDTGRNPRAWMFNGGAAVAPLGGRGNTASIPGFCGAYPFDAHSLAALMAPRAFYNCEALFWPQASPCGVGQLLLAARQAWIALGVSPSRICQRYTDVDSVGNGEHEMTQTHWTAMVDFCDFIYKGTPLPADNFTAGSRSIWCSSPSDFSSKFPGSPVFSALPQAYNWSTPILT